MIQRLRAWARQHTSEGRYSPIGVAFHWIMAALILFQLGWGWWSSRLPVGGAKLGGERLHAEIGLVIFLLALLRFAWRLAVPDPVNDADKPGWQSRVAHVTAWIFYLCFFGLPLTGWAMWSALGETRALYVAGLLPWPQLPFAQLDPAWQWSILAWSEAGHQLLIVVLALLIPVHVVAALKHHFWDRHDVLEAMLPHVPDEEQSRRAPKHKQQRRRFRPVSLPD